MITESVSFPFLFCQEVGTADALLARVCRPRMSMTDGTDAMSYANLQQSAALQGTVTESQERLSILQCATCDMSHAYILAGLTEY